MREGERSLNLAISTAMIATEALRQVRSLLTMSDPCEHLHSRRPSRRHRNQENSAQQTGSAPCETASVAEFEAIEDDICGPKQHHGCGPFCAHPLATNRPIPEPRVAAGIMSIMKGRVFEKVGVHVSTVHGEFAPPVSRSDSRGLRRPALLGCRHFTDRPPA